jgi:6-phosphogluconolactonase (cycloisomerase 2 family)
MVAGSIGAPAFAESDSFRRGKIFSSSNSPSGNALLVYSRADSGAASFLASIATNGTGTGAGLGSQGAVTLSQNGQYLFVVNAQSNTVSTFALRGSTATLTSVVASGGLTPISVSENDGLVYVLNAGGVGNVAGFRNDDGQLAPIADGIRGLSVPGSAGGAQVSFNRDGDVLVVSEKATSVLTSFKVGAKGALGNMAVTPSAGRTPFGFAFTRRDYLIVSEAAGSTVSSYRFNENAPATPVVVSAAVPNTQAAACWIAVTPDGKYAYSANAGSSSVSSFGVARSGSLSLLAAQAGLTGTNAGAVDMAVTPDGQQLHVFASRALQIVSFTIAADGSLAPLGAVGGLPPGSAGLAAN